MVYVNNELARASRHLTVGLTDNESYALLTIRDEDGETLEKIDVDLECQSYMDDMEKAIVEFHRYLEWWGKIEFPHRNISIMVDSEVYETTFDQAFMESGGDEEEEDFYDDEYDSDDDYDSKDDYDSYDDDSEDFW